MSELFLREDFVDHIKGVDPFTYVSKLQGKVYRQVTGRVTMRFEVEGKGYFLKWHKGVGWPEIIKNLLNFRLPILGARNEWKAIQELTAAGVGTMTLAAYGERGLNPATKESFVVTEALDGTVSLEDLCEQWVEEPPDFRFKRNLIKKVAMMARTLRQRGMNHRDFYICHFLLDTTKGFTQQSSEEMQIHLIDLHRAQVRKNIPYRWLVKDIGSLYFSAMDIGLTQRDLFYFMKVYSGKTLYAVFSEDTDFWRDVDRRAKQLYSQPKSAQDLAGNDN